MPSSDPEKRKTQRRAWVAANLAAGLCRCGKPLAADRKSCAKCLAASLDFSRRQPARTESDKARRKLQARIRSRHNQALGLCKCGRPKAFSGGARCDRCLKSRYKTRYGVTLEAVREMLLDQCERCAICRSDFKSGADCHVDHCHATGKVRGLLCAVCNMQLGVLEKLIASGLIGSMLTYRDGRLANGS